MASLTVYEMRKAMLAPDEIEKPRYGIKHHTHLFLFFSKNLVITDLTQM